MQDETRNVELLKGAYSSWSESRGASVDDWFAICAENIAFGSIAQGRPEGASYLTAYQGRNALKDYFGGIARDWEMVEYCADHYVAQGDRVVMLGRCAWNSGKLARSFGRPRRIRGASRTARPWSITSISTPRRSTRR